MNASIQEFVDMLKNSRAAQCTLEFFDPVTGGADLIFCPIYELEGATMHYIVGNALSMLGHLIDEMVNKGITSAVNSVIPADLYLEIPDLKSALPVSLWFFACVASEMRWPGRGKMMNNLG